MATPPTKTETGGDTPARKPTARKPAAAKSTAAKKPAAAKSPAPKSVSAKKPVSPAAKKPAKAKVANVPVTTIAAGAAAVAVAGGAAYAANKLGKDGIADLASRARTGAKKLIDRARKATGTPKAATRSPDTPKAD